MRETSETRLFFVVDSLEDSEEIFETLEEAQMFKKLLSRRRTQDEVGEPNKPRLRICLVLNAYKERDGSWNYDDVSNTFECIKELHEARED